MNEIKHIRLDIAASIFMQPCTERELCERELCQGMALASVQRFIMQLEKDALFYKGDVMHIKRAWAVNNLQEYELDFRTEKQKYIDSLSPFAKKMLGY